MKKFIESTQYMRDAQKQYFKTRSKDDLLNAKKWEQEVDSQLFEIKVLIIKTPRDKMENELKKFLAMD